MAVTRPTTLRKLLLTVGGASMIIGGCMLNQPAQAGGAPESSGQSQLDRTVLPILEPQYPHSTVLDARNATPPPRFEVKALTCRSRSYVCAKSSHEQK